MNPTRTVYINNINERVPVNHVKKEFLAICSEFGNVLNVIAHKGIKKRGQAFVVFDDLQSAAKAHDTLQNYVWQGKRINVAYAYTDSDVNLTEQERLERKQEKKSRAAESGTKPSDERLPETAESRDSRASRESELRELQESRELAGSVETVDQTARDYGEPHNMLLLKQIPETVTLEDLQTKLDDLAGFVDVRMLAVKHVGFIEFDSIDAASEAISWIEDQAIGEVVYAK